MATTRIMPLHIGKGRTESRAISEIIDYVANPQKTDHGRLITGYECDSRVADAEFMLAKRQYIAVTGRVRGADDVIAYHVRQSFCPGEITPEEANRLGVEFAKRFTKGKHAFIVCTHIDKAHVHNHIIWSSVNLDCDRKFRNFWGSTKAVRRLSDTICIENGLSIVENPKPHGKSYDQWLGDQAKPSHRELLRAAIDNALAQKPADLDELLKLLRESGCEVSKRGKSYRLKLPGWGNVAGLEEAVLLTLKKQLEILLPVHEDGTIHLEATAVKCSEYEKQLEVLKDQKQALFERYLLGQIELDAYKSRKAVYDAEILKVKNAYAAVTAQAKLKREEQARQSNRQEIAHSIAAADVLTSELTDLLIEKVYVFPDNRIEIVYKVHDLFE